MLIWLAHPDSTAAGVCSNCARLHGHRDGDRWSSDPDEQQLLGLRGPPPLHLHCHCTTVEEEHFLLLVRRRKTTRRIKHPLARPRHPRKPNS